MGAVIVAEEGDVGVEEARNESLAEDDPLTCDAISR